MGGYISLFAGTVAADQTGTPGRTVGLALIAMLQELYGSGQVTIALAAGTYNDLDPGSSFPLNAGMLDLSVTSGVAIITGLIPGSYNGHKIRVRQTGAGVAQLPTFNAGSVVANRFQGVAGSLSLSQWQSHDLIYYTGQGWQI